MSFQSSPRDDCSRWPLNGIRLTFLVKNFKETLKPGLANPFVNGMRPNGRPAPTQSVGYQRNQSVSLVQPAILIPDQNTEPDSAADAYCLAVAIAVTVTASLAYFDGGA